MPVYEMEQMTWPEVRDALEHTRVAILPTGSQEQHGPHLALSVDIGGAEAFARLLAEATHPLCLLAPPLKFGISFHHMPFPGTLTLRPETFEAALMDVAASLKAHGIERLFIVNGHGGNQNALGVASVKMRRDLGVRMAYTLWPIVGAAAVGEHVRGRRLGHACLAETSAMLHVRPDLVRSEALAEGDLAEPIYGDAPTFGIDGFLYWNEISNNGALEGAPDATAEIGKKMTDTALEQVTKFVRRFAELGTGAEPAPVR